MARTSQPDPARQVIVGVDTHKYIHVAVALDQHGARLGELSVSADSKGYQQLHDWARGYGRVKTYGVEGTGSYGVGLAKFLRRAGVRVLEVNRSDRQLRYQHGKSDPLDRERREVGAKRHRDQRAQVRRRGLRDDPPDQGRARRGAKGPVRGPDRPQEHCRQRSERTA